jgi:hypothetical protein
MRRDEDAGKSESERILARVAGEAGAERSTVLGRAASRALGHMKGADAEPGDRVEMWGMRIGRAFSLVALVLLSLWLLRFLMRGG